MKRMLLICLIMAALLLLKLLVPPNRELQRRSLAFLGLEQEAVQAIGKKMDEKVGWLSAFSADP